MIEGICSDRVLMAGGYDIATGESREPWTVPEGTGVY